MQVEDLIDSVHILKRTAKRTQHEKKELRTAAKLHRQRIAAYQKELEELNRDEQRLAVSGGF